MKCSICFNNIVSTYICRTCNLNFCSLSCIEIHYSKFHNKKKSLSNSVPIHSPYLIYGFLNNFISYDSFFSLKNFVPIFDEYGKLKVIGSGSYGQVYLALHTINKKYYAIKHMDKKKLYSLLHSLSSIQKEIDIQSKIDHPNIVKLLFVKETNISYDLIMEYASAGSLFHYIRKYKGLNENKSFSLFIQIVNAINFLHQNDFIHRDIKPENILMYDNNIIKLCDFGWCVKLEGHQRGTFCGTTEYMSPELVNHEGYGKEIDVWSLGVLLYEMIHGYSPFRPNKPKFNEKDVMENIKNHNIIFGKKVTDECKELIYHLLDPNINLRYKVEDIYNSSFVKKYELMHYDYPSENLVSYYNKELNQNNIVINQNKENINTNTINNSQYQEISSQIELKTNNNNNSYHNSLDSIIYSINNNNNNQIQDCNNIYNNNINNFNARNLNTSSLNKGVYSENLSFIINNSVNNVNGNFNNNIYSNNNFNNNEINNSNIIFENNENQRNLIKEKKFSSNKTANNFYPINIEKNRENEIIAIYHEHNNIEKVPEDNKRDNNQFINFNNNHFLFLAGNNQNNNIVDKNQNELIQVNEICNNTNNNDNNITNKINNVNTQYIQIEQQENNNIINDEIANKLISNINNNSSIQNIDNNINYNYYYNFNNYNNNYTNNFFNNSYNSISNQIIKKSPIPLSNTNNINDNSINLKANYNYSINNNSVVDKIKTPSTIPTTSNKIITKSKNQNKIIKEAILNKNKIIIDNKAKISEFEIGEENYNLSEKEQIESDSISIKININKESQKINNRKYLSKSDYSILNKKQKNIQSLIKNQNIYNIRNNSQNNTLNNSSTILSKNEEIINLKQKSIQKKISLIDLKNKNKLGKETIMENSNISNNENDKIKILDEKRNNIKIHEIKVANMSIPFPKKKKKITKSPKNNKDRNRNNLLIEQKKSKSFCGANDNNILVEINNKSNNNIINNNNNISIKENLNKENKSKVIGKINNEKKEYLKSFKEGNINKNKIIIKSVDNDLNQNNFIGDMLCSIFHAFDSKKNEINILKEEKNYGKNGNYIMKNNLLNKEKLKSNYDHIKPKNNSFIKMSLSPNPKKEIKKILGENYKINKEENKNNRNIANSNKASFIKISNRNNYNYRNVNQKILNLGHAQFENSHSATNINKYSKINILSNTQPNSSINNNKFNEFKKDVHYHKQLLKLTTSPIIINKNEKININEHFGNDIKNNILKEIPIIIKDNDINDEINNDLVDSKIITPKKRYIFNRVNPIKLLGAFKKELTTFSKKEQLLRINNKK